MEFAISMYKGGVKVYADECDSDSYDILKLRCSVCGEPVYLKEGNTRKPHFAHFHATNARQMEPCELRASSYGNSTEDSILIEDKGQRLEIFQNNFLNMISDGKYKIVDDLKFNDWITIVKKEYYQIIDYITKSCTEYFLIHQKQMKEKSCVYFKNDAPLIQKQIAFEAMDYLCVKSSLHLLDCLLHYNIYQLYVSKNEEYKLFHQNITTEDIDKICQETARIIMLNPWTEAVNNAKNPTLLTINDFQSSNSEGVEIRLIPPLQIFLADVLSGTKGKSNKNINSSNINASQLSRYERDKLKSPLPLYHVFASVQYNSRGFVKKTIDDRAVYCKVVTEINTDENTAIQFSFQVNEFIKADSLTKNANGKYIKQPIEIWHSALVYKFGPNFELSVEHHDRILFLNGGYLEEFPELKIKTRCELANLFVTIIDAGQVKFIKTIEQQNKLLIDKVYDCSVLLLWELLEHSHIDGVISNKTKYKPIEFNTVMQCIIDAANKALQLGVPLIEGMLLHSLYTAAKVELKSSKLDKIPTRNITHLSVAMEP